MKVNDKIRQLKREGKSSDFILGFLEGSLYGAETSEKIIKTSFKSQQKRRLRKVC